MHRFFVIALLSCPVSPTISCWLEGQDSWPIAGQPNFFLWAPFLSYNISFLSSPTSSLILLPYMYVLHCGWGICVNVWIRTEGSCTHYCSQAVTEDIVWMRENEGMLAVIMSLILYQLSEVVSEFLLLKKLQLLSSWCGLFITLTSYSFLTDKQWWEIVYTISYWCFFASQTPDVCICVCVCVCVYVCVCVCVCCVCSHECVCVCVNPLSKAWAHCIKSP